MEHHLLSEYKHKIKTGDLLAFKVRRYGSITSFFLWLYHKIFRVNFSHVGIAVRLGERVFMVEAISPRVAITPISKVREFYLIPTELKATEKTQIDFLINFVEVKYSLKDLITYYLGMDVSDDTIYCSELASAFYFHVGYLHERESGHTPEKIVNAVLKRSGVEEPIHIVTDRGNL